MHRNGFCCVYSIITLTSCRHNGHSPAPFKKETNKMKCRRERETLDFTTNPSGRILSFSIIKHFNGFASFLWRDPTFKGSHGIAFVEVFIHPSWMDDEKIVPLLSPIPRARAPPIRSSDVNQWPTFDDPPPSRHNFFSFSLFCFSFFFLVNAPTGLTGWWNRMGIDK